MKRCLSIARLAKPTKVVSMIFVICLLMCGRLNATSTYNYLSDVTINFNQSWTSYNPVITSITSGTGLYTASIAPILQVNSQDRSIYQAAHVLGSAGDADLINGGISHSYNLFETFVTFIFNAPTDLTITLADYNQKLVSSRDLNSWNGENQTGEYIGYWPGLGGGGTVLQLAMDGIYFAPGPPYWEDGASATFSNLTGQHTVLLRTSADESALAGYPYVRTPEQSSLVLLGVGLAGVIVVKRRRKRNCAVSL